jgi:hypothetical protein
MLVVWLHTFVARNGWGAGMCVCVARVPEGICHLIAIRSLMEEAWPILDAIAK